MLRFWHAASAVLAILLVANSNAAEAKRFGTVTAGVLNVRAKPARHFERIAKFKRGDEVRIVQETDEWLEVLLPQDAKAWVAREFLAPDGVVTATELQVRSGPGVVFTSYATVKKGDALTPLGPPLDEWQQVLAPAGTTGWVNRAYVRLGDPIPAAAVAKAEEPKPVATEAPPAAAKNETKPTTPKPPKAREPKEPPAATTVAANAEPAPPAPAPPTAKVEAEAKPKAPSAAIPETPKTTVVSAKAPSPEPKHSDGEFVRQVVKGETGVEIIVAQDLSHIPEAKPPAEPPAETHVVATLQKVRTAPPNVTEQAPVAKAKPAEKPPVPKKVVDIVKTAEAPEKVAPKPPEKAVASVPDKVAPKPPEKVVDIVKTVEAPEKAAPKPPEKVVASVPDKVAPKPPEKVVASVPTPTPPAEETVFAPPVTVAPEEKPAAQEKPANEEVVYMAPIVAPDAPSVPRPNVPPARYEAPMFVAKGTPAPKTIDLEPEKPQPQVKTDAPEAHETAVVETPAPAPIPTPAPADGRTPKTKRDGVLFSLKDQAVPEASHILYRREGTVLSPICYLRSERIDLAKWELREVRVYGIEQEVTGWSRPVINVTGVQLLSTR
jgi:SH3-like domain-containing protein